jgi:hypothetical protein
MWEQYAEGHRGLCLLFAHDRLIKKVSAQLAGLSSYRHGDVVYRPMSDGLRPAPQVPWEHAASAGVVEGLVESLAPETFFGKFDDYASEQEYRSLLGPPTSICTLSSATALRLSSSGRSSRRRSLDR